MQRRAVLSQLATVAGAISAPGAVLADSSTWSASVGGCAESKDKCFSTIAEALAAAPQEAVITLRPGVYKERVTVSAGSSVTLQADPPGSATLDWSTTKPYESVVEVRGGQAVLKGLRLRHASKSVANNYAVFSSSGKLELEDCDVSSSTGAGVGAEGGTLRIRGGSVSDCPRQGLALYGPLSGDPLQATICGTKISGNGKSPGDYDAVRGPFDGVLARSGVEAQLTGVTIEGSGRAGIAAFEDTTIVVKGAMFNGNSRGDKRVQNRGVVEVLSGSPGDSC